MADMVEVRWHGRGGQGAKTAAYLLAEAISGEGKQIQAFPEYGPERMGAPIRAFVRISDENIRMHCPVTEPEVVVVLDPTLLGKVDVLDGVPEGGTLVVNTDEAPGDLAARLDAGNRKVWTVAATEIAMDTIKRPIPNTVMLGALAKATGLMDLDKLKGKVKHKFGDKLKQEILEGNITAIDRAYQEVQST